MWVYLNSDVIQEQDAKISVLDHSFLYGDGVYETLRVYQGKLFLWERHLERLHQSCELIGLNLPIHDDEWLPIFRELLDRNHLQNAGFRVTVSRGQGELGIDPKLCAHPTLVVMAKSVQTYSEQRRDQGLTLHVSSVCRNSQKAQPPQIKATSFLNNILAKREANQEGADDALMLNLGGYVAECTTSNIFFVRAQRLYTPAVRCGILKGVTRDVVMELAKEQGVKVEEGKYVIEELQQADECFITNTGSEIMAVSRIGSHPISHGKQGVITKELYNVFQQNLNRFLGPCLTMPTR